MSTKHIFVGIIIQIIFKNWSHPKRKHEQTGMLALPETTLKTIQIVSGSNA